MANVFRCNYMVGALYRVGLKYHSTEKKEKFDEFKSQFCHVDMDYQTFLTYFTRFMLNASKKKLKNGVREAWSNKFSIEKWNALDDDYKKLHTLHECQPCKFYIFDPLPKLPVPTLSADSTCSTTQSLDSVPSTPLAASSSNLNLPKTPTTPFSTLHIDIPIHTTPSVKHQKEAASAVMTTLDKEFNNAYGETFTDVICKVKESKLQLKPTEAERKKKDRKIRRDVRDKLQNVMYSRDAEVLFGTRQTSTQYEKQRKAIFMESPADAKTRTEKRKLFYFMNHEQPVRIN